MKQIKQMSFVAVTLLLLVGLVLTACGANVSLPSEGLTGAMGVNEASSSMEDPITLEAFNSYLEVSIIACAGALDVERNLMRTSFQMESGGEALVENADEVFLFSSGNPLLGEATASADGNVQYRCEGGAQMTAVPFTVNDEIIGWVAALEVPELILEYPSGEEFVFEEIIWEGFVAASLEDVNEIIAAVNGLSRAHGFATYTQVQKALFDNYPNQEYVQELTLNDGMSPENAARMGELFVEKDEEQQWALAVDIIASADDRYVAGVVGATVNTLQAMGVDDATIAALFAEETNGRITVHFSQEKATVPVQVTSRDEAGDIVVTMYGQNSDIFEQNNDSDEAGDDGGSSEGLKMPNWLKKLFKAVAIGALTGLIGALTGGAPLLVILAAAGRGAAVGAATWALGELSKGGGDGFWTGPNNDICNPPSPLFNC